MQAGVDFYLRDAHIRNFSWGRKSFQFHYGEINRQNPSRHGKSAIAVAAKHPKQSSGIGTEGRFHRPLWGEKRVSKQRAACGGFKDSVTTATNGVFLVVF